MLLKSEGIEPSLPFLQTETEEVEDPIKDIILPLELKTSPCISKGAAIKSIWLRAGWLPYFLWVWGDMIWKWKMKKRTGQCSAYWCDAPTLLRGQCLEIAEQLENDFSSSVQVKMVQMKCIPSAHQACPALKSALNPFYLPMIRMFLSPSLTSPRVVWLVLPLLAPRLHHLCKWPHHIHTHGLRSQTSQSPVIPLIASLLTTHSMASPKSSSSKMYYIQTLFPVHVHCHHPSSCDHQPDCCQRLQMIFLLPP